MRSMRRVALGILAIIPILAALYGRTAIAEERPMLVDIRLGPAFLTKSGSHAIGHLFKPAARLGLRVTLGERLEVGGSVGGLLSTSEHYRVLGAVAHVRYALWSRPDFSLGASAALGLGYDADILHADLHADGRISPYGFLALDGRWALGPSWLVGVEASWENVAVMHLGVLVGRRFGGPSPAGSRP